MSTGDKNPNSINQVVDTFMTGGANDFSRYAALVGTALAGGALYYYLNNNKPQVDSIIDYKNQTRESEVKKEI